MAVFATLFTHRAAACALVASLVGCGDDTSEPTTDTAAQADTAQGGDTAATDDTVGSPDTSANDVVTGDDTVAMDASSGADATEGDVSMVDVSSPEDTSDPSDTATATDTTTPDDVVYVTPFGSWTMTPIGFSHNGCNISASVLVEQVMQLDETGPFVGPALNLVGRGRAVGCMGGDTDWQCGEAVPRPVVDGCRGDDLFNVRLSFDEDFLTGAAQIETSRIINGNPDICGSGCHSYEDWTLVRIPQP